MRPGRAVLLALAAAAALALGYGAYWRAMAARVEAALHSFAATERAHGRVVQFEMRGIGGFPGWIILDLADVFLADSPEATGWLVAAQAVGARARPWSLTRVEAWVPEGRALRAEWQAGALLVQTGPARLDLDLDPRGRLAALTLRAPSASIGDDPGMAVADLRLDARVDGGTDTLDATLAAARLTPPPGLAPPFDGPIAAATLTLRLNALSRLDGGAEALDAWRAGGGRARVLGMALGWGALAVEGAGDVGLDAALRPEGRIDLLGRGYEGALEGLVAAGRLGERSAVLIRAVLDLFAARAAGGERAVRLPLEARDGTLFLGPLPVAALPSLAPPP